MTLVSVGLQLRLDALRGNRTSLALGLTYKRIAAPALLAMLYVTDLEPAMGPQVGGAIVASQCGLNPALVALMVGVATLLAFMTAPSWWELLTFAA